ncbi:MAG TPA: cysteine--tRNA ligase [Candidatus Eisenbacteria bacterium]|nr:cysteine--tRNA ligase [Candidatus Eisenbacteria bacterium]
MPLQISNSLSKKKEIFAPLEEGVVKMYVCGPTVYDEPHIGHLRSAYVFEVVRNYLKYCRYKVRFARNVTDVDDKIIEKARALGAADLNAATTEVSRKYFDLYKNDLRRMGIQEPDFEPKATEFIPQMIGLIEKLVASGHAYAAEGDVYFEVNRFAEYGEVSHQRMDQMLEEVRIEPNAHKKTPLDFALWKRAKEGEPAWDSPWGKGRPGWHIECSAMSLDYFKGAFDIHGGGRDLIFPHHENENAQSRCATGHPFVNLWMHHGLITVAGKKMSKSLKNFITLGEVLKDDPDFGDEILKLSFLGTHYSAALDYTPERVKMERQVWKRFLDFFEAARQHEKNGVKLSEKRLTEVNQSFREAMDNDFNTPEVLARMHGLMHETYKAKDAIGQLSVAAAIRNFGSEVFGIVFDQTADASALKPEIERAILDRAQARKNKDFKSADEIRNRLLQERNVELRDLPDGRTTWRVRL